MERYDPDIPAPGDDWLRLEERQRVVLVEGYHRDARVPLPKSARTPHAVLHVIVENQLAKNDERVASAVTRLMGQGLTRHEAIHAIGTVIAGITYDLRNLGDAPDAVRERYYAAIDGLSVQPSEIPAK
jgi:hypothetical protein